MVALGDHDRVRRLDADRVGQRLLEVAVEQKAVARSRRIRPSECAVVTLRALGSRPLTTLRVPVDLGTFIEETLGRRAGLAITQRESGRPG